MSAPCAPEVSLHKLATVQDAVPCACQYPPVNDAPRGHSIEKSRACSAAKPIFIIDTGLGQEARADPTALEPDTDAPEAQKLVQRATRSCRVLTGTAAAR